MCETKSVTGALYLDMNESLPDVSALEDEYAKLWKKISDTTKLNEPMEAECARVEELTTEIEKGHDYVFIGRVGQFCPIKPGCGGGLLCRESVDKKTGEKKYDAAVGTKGYCSSRIRRSVYSFGAETSQVSEDSEHVCE